ncbi:Amuc_1100 family pilus-like protein [Oleiharenicola lentus]|uniref:Amuc_1100 family pilus-like protein n=1 Tax=Oleiharenicola lentus TaxID=2508720 RepID=UPI00100AD855|nr:Amuc_1100 family pilus-like protein [Oleiharenicola lentus]
MLIATVVAGFGVELWLLQVARQQAQRSLLRLKGKQQEQAVLAGQIPAVNAENVRILAGEIQAARAMLVSLQAEFAIAPEEAKSGPGPERPVESYFSLQDTWQKLAREAAAAGVKVGAGETFGFSRHAKEGPAVALLPTVRRQQILTEELLGALFAAQPEKLLAIRREDPAAAGAPRATEGAGDFHVPAPGLLVRQAGMIDSDSFRLEFSGTTSVLREFMRALAVAPRPALVRSVELEPAQADQASGAGSRFSLLVEFPRVASGPSLER